MITRFSIDLGHNAMGKLEITVNIEIFALYIFLLTSRFLKESLHIILMTIVFFEINQ